LPVESKILPSGIGYVRVTSTADNRELILAQFEAALQQFQVAQATGLIIDLSVVVNLTPETSLSSLGLAGFLSNEPIPLGQLQFAGAGGAFENEGAPETIQPRAIRYSFPAYVLLVGPACARSCELEAYALSQVPGMIVVGHSPTAGVVSDASRGQFLLPEGFTFQFPTGRYILPDGTVFLEGQGTPLTARVPVDEDTVLSLDDILLTVAEAIVQGNAD
jgi:C-terminal processing protease CtpA/Prc